MSCRKSCCNSSTASPTIADKKKISSNNSTNENNNVCSALSVRLALSANVHLGTGTMAKRGRGRPRKEGRVLKPAQSVEKSNAVVDTKRKSPSTLEKSNGTGIAISLNLPESPASDGSDPQK
ncbi:hypothetical protein HAX54_015364 [Datura stramonium]|uniref:Uncharacterized protein n=1 Tax=Datura stramonium TaxID=4076 RepID=A0ABS8RZA6_DATST|nr:hypothetical protein [Datura stramonium]